MFDGVLSVKNTASTNVAEASWLHSMSVKPEVLVDQYSAGPMNCAQR